MSRVFFILFPWLLFAGCKNQQGSEGSLQINDVKLLALDGKAIDLKAYAGKIVFINFWATWCKPCIEEMPSIQNAITTLSDKEIVFLFASDETKAEIETFISANNYQFKFLTAGNMEELNVRGLPTTFIFDTNGKLVFSEMGARKWDSKENIALLTKIADQ
jgi:thiol-disulfide isomerase/thioredoxin